MSEWVSEWETWQVCHPCAFLILCNYCATIEEGSSEDKLIHRSNSCQNPYQALEILAVAPREGTTKIMIQSLGTESAPPRWYAGAAATHAPWCIYACRRVHQTAHYKLLSNLFCIDKGSFAKIWVSFAYTWGSLVHRWAPLTVRQCISPSGSLNHTVTYCNALQHTATHCNTLQCNNIPVSISIIPSDCCYHALAWLLVLAQNTQGGSGHMSRELEHTPGVAPQSHNNDTMT